jgi:peptidoglycan/LPS O-acetylase OafA/YrhL
VNIDTSPVRLAHPTHRADLDGLRAVAVLSVVGFHAFPAWVHGGFIGVDVFFVISGFLISSILIGSLEQHRFDILEFYARRIRRIFPALLVLLGGCLAFGWWALLADENQQLGKHVASGAGFVANLVLWRESGYFDAAADTKPLLHLWSLGIEEQFYILWPLLLWAAWRARVNLLAVALVLGLGSFALNTVQVHRDAVAAFYSPQTRGWELLVGAALAYLKMHPVSQLRRFAATHDWLPARGRPNVVSASGALLLAVGLVTINRATPFPGWRALLPTLGTCLMIAAGPQAWLNRVVLSNRLLTWFGLISYPLYLWHWPLLSFARVVGGGPAPAALRLVLVAVAIVLAWLTYRFIERPIRAAGRGSLKAGALLLLMLVVGGIGYGSFRHDALAGRSLRSLLDPFYESGIAGYIACRDPRLLQGDALNYCLVDERSGADAALIGDSKADDKFYGFVNHAGSRHWMLLGNTSCPPVYGIQVEDDQPGCQEKFEKIFSWLATRPQIRTVVLSFYGNYFLTSAFAADHIINGSGPEHVRISAGPDDERSRAELFFSGLSQAIDQLETAHKEVVVLIDVPELPFQPRDCHRRSDQKDCTLTHAATAARQAEHRLMIARLQRLHPGIRVFDPTDLFCPGEACVYQGADQLLYRDSIHLSRYGSDRYGQAFSRWLDTVSF